MPVFSKRFAGKPPPFYAQQVQLPEGMTLALFAGVAAPGDCAGRVGTVPTDGGAWAGRDLGMWLVREGCDVLE